MQVPDLDWVSIMASAKTGHVSFRTGCNEYHLPSGVTIQVVDHENQLGEALASLRESMQASAPTFRSHLMLGVSGRYHQAFRPRNSVLGGGLGPLVCYRTV